jgi:dTMP kinase
MMGLSEPKLAVPVVAVCGIDGAGKTSTCASVGLQSELRGVAVVGKRDRRDVQLLRRLLPVAEIDEMNLLSGPYAEAVRWAHALDFLRFYDHDVLPRNGQAWLVISDRWTVCSIAYADVGTDLGQQIAAALAPCRPADLIVYLDIDPEAAVHRIRQRGDGRPDESLAILRHYREMYERWLPRSGSEVVRIGVGDRSASEVQRLATDAILTRFRPPALTGGPRSERQTWSRSRV